MIPSARRTVKLTGGECNTELWLVSYCNTELWLDSETHWGRVPAFLAAPRCEIWMEIFIITGQKGNKAVNYGRWTEKCKTNSGLMRNSAHAHLLLSDWAQAFVRPKINANGVGRLLLWNYKAIWIRAELFDGQGRVLWYWIAVNWVLVTHQWNSKSKVNLILIGNILYQFRIGPSAFDKLICTIDQI